MSYQVFVKVNFSRSQPNREIVEGLKLAGFQKFLNETDPADLVHCEVETRLVVSTVHCHDDHTMAAIVEILVTPIPEAVPTSLWDDDDNLEALYDYRLAVACGAW